MSRFSARGITMTNPGRDQCGYCGGWYDLTPQRMTGVCPTDEGQAVNGLFESEW